MSLNIHEEYIRILISAKNDASKAMTDAGAEARGLQATFLDVGKGMIKGGLVVGAMGVGLGVGVAALTKAGMDYQTMLSQLQGNTTITNAQIGAVSAAVLKLHSDTGAPLQDLVTSFQHVTNAGFSVADAMKIVQQGTMSAISTGGNAANINNTLAIVMHEFGMSANEAAKAVNVLHLASAMSNTTMEQFATGTTKAQAFAANLGISFTQTEAALAALGRRFSASQSSTMFAGELVKIVAASKGAEASLRQMQARTGIPLVRDFTQAGLASRGFTQVQADLAKAVQETGVQMMTLIPATRGGLAAMVLGGTGAKDYNTILASLNDTMAGKTNPTMDAFARQQKTLTGEIQDLRGALDTTAVTIGLQLVPQMTGLLNTLNPAISGFNEWARANSGVIAKLLPLGAAALTIAGGLTAAAGAVVILGTVMSPLGLTILGLFTLTGLFIDAWIHNSGNIRQVVGDLGKAFDDLRTGHMDRMFRDLDKAASDSTGRLRDIMTSLQTIARLMRDIQSGNWSGAAGILQGAATASNAHKVLSAVDAATGYPTTPVGVFPGYGATGLFGLPLFPGLGQPQFAAPNLPKGPYSGAPFSVGGVDYPGGTPRLSQGAGSLPLPGGSQKIYLPTSYGGTGANGPTSVTQNITVHVAVSGDMTHGSASKVGDAIKEAFRTMRDTPKRANAYLPGAR